MKLERQNTQNKTIFELDNDDDKLKFSNSPKDILKSVKKYMENSKQKEVKFHRSYYKFLTERIYLIV